MKRCEKSRSGQDGDLWARRPSDDGKQAAAKNRFFHDWTKHYVENQQVTDVDQVGGRSSCTSNEVDRERETRATKQSDNEILSTRQLQPSTVQTLQRCRV